jgi:hypothetical protein
MLHCLHDTLSFVNLKIAVAFLKGPEAILNDFPTNRGTRERLQEWEIEWTANSEKIIAKMIFLFMPFNYYRI